MKIRSFLVLSMVSFVSVFVAVLISADNKNIERSVQFAQDVFNEKIQTAKEYSAILSELDIDKRIELKSLDKAEGIGFYEFENDSLIYWSNNTIPLAKINIDTLENKSLLTIAYSNYFCLIDSHSGNKFLTLIHLSSQFPYENKFLKNGFNSSFRLLSGTKISLYQSENTLPVYDLDENVAFYIDYSQTDQGVKIGFQIAATFFFFLGIFFLLSVVRLLLYHTSEQQRNKFAALAFFGLIVFRYVLLISGLLNNHLFLFDPFIYATRIAPTFGDLLLNTFFFVFLTYLLNRFVKVPKKFLTYSFNRHAWVGILNLVFILTLVYAYYTSASLITHSSMKVVVHNISQLRFPVVIAYLVFALNYLGLLLVAVWISRTLHAVKFYRIIINCYVQLGLLVLITFLLDFPIDAYTIIFAALLFALSIVFQEQFKRNAILSTLVVLLMFFSVYIMLFSTRLTDKKDFQINKSQAISLSTEHDPIAEYLFDDLTIKFKGDTTLKNMLLPEQFNFDRLYDYLTKNYFSGYWKSYEARITICRPSDSVQINGNEMFWYPCYSFFEELSTNFGMQIPGTNFYYIDKLSGLINYFGWIEYAYSDKGLISLFIELDSRLTTKPLGYPELLLDEGLKSKRDASEISYAKYHKGKLISHHGDYGYSLISKAFQKKNDAVFFTTVSNNYTHLIFRPNNENLIVVSEKKTQLIDYLVLFSYVFVFYYLTSLLVIFLFVSQFRHISFRDSLRNRIQFSVILILIVSLVLIAGSTTWFNIRKYNQTQFRILEEKINSVYVELEHKLSFEERLSADWSTNKYDNLSQLLTKFSDVFYSDINLYDPHGNLLATSREQVFRLGLQSKKMDPLAYFKMNNEKLAQFVHRENINQLSYLSAYVPFLNSQGELLAYLNLPYFTKQKELQEDITTLTVAIVNIYVLLILLTIVFAVVISDQITKPLEMIQNRFRALKLGGKHEPIKYSKTDEIGRLVNEYNKMVLELENNIDLLAKSERESAWREMAKQVAHEIKNPLTPMRLSVQQLKRTWDDKKEDFDKYLNRVTETLLEQIDNLSTIAGEFSNFAKMPIAKIEKVSISEVLSASVALFNANEKITIEFNNQLSGKELVMADSDQLSRVFINILKNGIQAIPDDKEGKIVIGTQLKGKKVVIDITDNGKGVSEDIKDKLFAPNFTTKSGGMGLGLAIVKNILESVDGEINFSTELNKGSTFTVGLPVIEN